MSLCVRGQESQREMAGHSGWAQWFSLVDEISGRTSVLTNQRLRGSFSPVDLGCGGRELSSFWEGCSNMHLCDYISTNRAKQSSGHSIMREPGFMEAEVH